MDKILEKSVWIPGEASAADDTAYLYFPLASDMAAYGYVKVGRAEIHIIPDDEERILQRQLFSLREALRQVDLKAAEKKAEINEQIHKLLALPAPGEGTDSTGEVDDEIPW